MSEQNTTILNSKIKDSSSKLIFDDPDLCSQFLRDYVGHIPCLREVQPEDIEDVSEQFVPLFAEERNADRVKKVHIKKDVPFFLISLIEHKTQVEYNVCMQIFRYMVYIWESYEKEAEKKQPDITRTKGFRYPPILPIVYYEGQDKWTVPLDFKSRILEGETFARYIPDFRYHLVPLCDYSNDELLANKDEISLVMLINKIQDEESLNVFRQLPEEELAAILNPAPDHRVRIIADVLKALLLKMNVSDDETEEIVGKVRKRNMGQLFEHMQPIDIQAFRKENAAFREEMAAEKEKIAAERQEMVAEREKWTAEREEMLAQIRQLQTEMNALRQNAVSEN